MTRASPVAPHETNRQAVTMTGTTSEVVRRVVVRGDDRYQMRGRTTMPLRRTEKHFESQAVANRLETLLLVNRHEVRKA